MNESKLELVLSALAKQTPRTPLRLVEEMVQTAEILRKKREERKETESAAASAEEHPKRMEPDKKTEKSL